jgi:adenylylsulfate kinase
MEPTHVVWHAHLVSRDERERLLGHHGCVVWFTGLSGCGKSTVANAVDRRLHEIGVHSFLLDGDNIRHGLNASPAMLAASHEKSFAERFGLGFDAADREENIRRIGCVADLFAQAGLVTLTAFVSPYRRDRDSVRRLVESHGRPGDFLEVHVNAPLAVCEQRDPKGLYQKARAGQLRNFTGIDDPYEPPEHPELVLQSDQFSPDQLAQQVLDRLAQLGKIPSTAGGSTTGK